MEDTPKTPRPGEGFDERLAETLADRAEAKPASDDPGEIREMVEDEPGPLRRNPFAAVAAAVGLGFVAGWLSRR